MHGFHVSLICLKSPRNPIRKSWLYNFTDVTIPINVIKILQLGPKFCHQFGNIPREKIISDLEYSLSRISSRDETKLETRKRMAGLLSWLQNYIHKKFDCNFISKQKFIQTAQFFKTNTQIIVTKADKGNATVLLDKADYTRKVLNLLEDTSTYKKCYLMILPIAYKGKSTVSF